MRILSIALLAALLDSDFSRNTGPSIPAVLREFDRICARPLWPGFEPCRIPLLIFDGERTWLVRHPSPPPEFASSGRGPGILLFEGRHSSVRANTSVELGGVTAASASLEKRSGGVGPLAALLVHEAFHVFEAGRHRGWSANEADLFLYPFEDASALALRRLESLSLQRALEAGRGPGAASWAARAMKIRRERFRQLPASAAAYERSSEMNEGLARYVERVSGGSSAPLFPRAEFGVAAVRDRTYASGAAMALLLDALGPGWKTRLEEKDTRRLDDLLADAVGAEEPASFHEGETAREARRAVAEVAAWNAERGRIRRDLLERAGWKIVIESREPLAVEGFDPLNVELVSASEVLHSRWLKVKSSSGRLEVLGRKCLTESAGKHPLFEGVRRVTVALGAEPHVEQIDGEVRISSDGLSLAFRGARLTRSGQVLRLEVQSHGQAAGENPTTTTSSR